MSCTRTSQRTHHPPTTASAVEVSGPIADMAQLPLVAVALIARASKFAIMKRMLNLEFHEVDAARWGDFERLFESPGGPKNCWCMVWRGGAKTTKGPDRKAAIQQYVSDDMPIGLLGYSEGEPVAWCSIAPRPTYRDLGGPNDA